MKTFFFLLLSSLFGVTFLNAQTVDLYFSLSDNDNVQCKFAAYEGCRLFKAPMALHRNSITGLLDSVSIDKSGFIELLPNEIRGVQPNVNSDNTYITFIVTKDTAGYHTKHIYAHQLGTSSIIDVSNGLSLITGTFPIWYSDNSILYNSTNNCSPPTNPGCDLGSRYSDLTKTILNGSISNVVSASRVWGDINLITNLDSKFCSFEDPIVSPNDSNLIAFHADPVIGGTTYDTIPIDCPFTYGLPTNVSSLGAEPQPIVVKMDAVASSNLIKDLVPGTDYWKFDLAGAGINGLAHLDWHPNGTIIGTEQGSTAPYRYCSDTLYGTNTTACVSHGGYMIPFDRPFGFELDNGMYRNIYRSTDTLQPLFDALHPAQLPKSSLFWNPSIQICNSFRAAKQIQFCGSPTTIIATVFCKDNSSAIHFSRMYIIDFADLHNPFYFDVTGWVEDNFPGRWADGMATAYSATCFVTNTTTSLPEIFDSNSEIRIYPNPTNGIFKVDLISKENTVIQIFNSIGKQIISINNTDEIDLSKEPNGIYFIHINSNEKIYNAKVIKQP